MRSKDCHTGNRHVLSDLGIKRAKELASKAVLPVKLNDLIKSRIGNQIATAWI